MQENIAEKTLQSLIDNNLVQKTYIRIWECLKYQVISGDWTIECILLDNTNFVESNRSNFAYRIIGPTVEFPWTIGTKLEILRQYADLSRNIPYLYTDLEPEPEDDDDKYNTFDMPPRLLNPAGDTV